MAYARIDEGFWTDPMIRSLSLEGKMIAAWLFTNPHRHFSGLYYLPKVLIQVETGVSIGVCDKELKMLEDKGFLKYAEGFQVVWVIKMLKHQAGVNSPTFKLSGQQITGIERHLHTLHGCPLIAEFIKYYDFLKIPLLIPLSDTPIDINSQSQSKSKSKSKNLNVPPTTPLFFSCQFFEIDFDYRMKLASEYPALTDELLKVEFSKMEDWIIDNKKRKTFKANGHLGNARLFIKNWLNKIQVNGQQIFGPNVPEPKGFEALREAERRRGQC